MNGVRPPGWNDHWSQEWAADDRGELVPCRVVRIDKGGITVSRCTPATSAWWWPPRMTARSSWATSAHSTRPAGRIEVILPRRTVFERRSPGVVTRPSLTGFRSATRRREHGPRSTSCNRLDPGLNTEAARTGARARMGERRDPPFVVLTKADLVDGPTGAQRQLADAQRFAPGAPRCTGWLRYRGSPTALEPAMLIRPARPRPCDRFCSARPARGSLGPWPTPSPATTVQLTAEVREGDRRGRHTTTAGQMVPLADGTLAHRHARHPGRGAVVRPTRAWSVPSTT